VAKLKLSKSALAQQRGQLALYKRLLPSLDLKRRQLTVEVEKARTEVAAARQAADELEARIGAELPMLAESDLDFTGLVRMTDAVVEEENVVGVRLPALKYVNCEVADYSLLAKPTWVDALVQRLRDAAEQRARVSVAEKRIAILEQAVRRVTQRVNLFDRILIPTAKDNIKRIQIYLGDLERDAVVRSKLAKGRSMAAQQASAEVGP
jgi:V/A-type H+-transporting ATPase subunit D